MQFMKIIQFFVCVHEYFTTFGLYMFFIELFLLVRARKPNKKYGIP